MRRAVTFAFLLIGLLFGPVQGHAQDMASYTAYPPYVVNSVTPNILFMVDLSEAMLAAAYGNYPESSGGKISSNVDGTGLCNTNTNTSTSSQPSGCPSVNVTADSFNTSTEYSGMFNPYRCYTYSSGQFRSPVAKASVSSQCSSSQWDGNFLNWLTMRKVDLAKKVLIGGRTLSASNSDGTANTLLGEPKTGSDGSTAKCNNSSSYCFRFVKQASGSGNRYPSTLPKDAGNVSYFGVGEGEIFVSAVVTESDVFGASPSNQFSIEVDLTTETDAVRKEQSTGLLQNLSTNSMRVAVMFINAGNGKAARVFREFDGNFNASAITGVRNQPLSAYAALGEGTYEALCYYRNSQGPCYKNGPADFSASVGAQGDPYFFVSNNQMVPCCKSYILMISSGQPTDDGDTPDLTAPFGNLFAIDSIGLSTTWLDDVAYYGKTRDIRDQASGAPGYLSGTQSVTFYSVNAMSGAAGSNVLASAAKYGGFEDQDNDGVPDATGQSCTYPAGSMLGSGTSVSNAEWDLDQDCVPDTYFEASQGSQLKATIETAIIDILKKAASGSSVSVLASSASGDGALYQAFFFPSEFEGLKEIKWTGYTEGLFVDAFGNLREDTDGDGKLVYANDYIIETRYDDAVGEVVADRFVDISPVDGKADSTTPAESVGLKDIKPIWEAGKQLALKAASARRILTWVDSDNDGAVDSGEVIDFTTSNSPTLAPYLRAGATPYTADNIINFIRGEPVAGLRNRQMTVGGSLKVWKFGDPIHSTPTIVGAPRERYDVLYGDTSYTDYFLKYKNRRQVAYVGANDGMLHAFNAGFYHQGDDPGTTTVTEHGWFTRTPTGNSGGPLLGDELWGFIPQELLPQLQWLTRTDYTHVYYVDLKPKVTDVRIFPDDATHPNGWGTILIGGFRMGGSCGACTAGSGAPPMTVTADFGSGTQTRTFYSGYFVLDITDPEVDPTLLWVFTDSALGLSVSYPAVLRVSPSGDANTANTNAKWVIAVGSGPTAYDGDSAQTGKIFALEMPKPVSAGSSLVVSTFPTSDSKSFMSSVSSLDANFDYRTDASYLGTVINNGTNPDWAGKLYRLTTGLGSANPATWGIDSGGNRVPTVLLASFPASGTTTVGPISAAPGLTVDDSGQYWVFFGTGRYYSSADKTNAEAKYFFGVKDPVVTGGCTQSAVTSCEQQDLVNVSNAQVCIVCSGGTDQVTGVTGVTSLEGTATSTLQGLVQSKDGWYTRLPATRERVIVSPTVIGGIVFFPSFTPTGDVCSSSGSGTLYALFYQTGSAYAESVIGTEVSGSDTNVSRSVSMGTGMASQAAVHIGAQGTDAASSVTGRMTICSQSDSGALSCRRTSPPLSSWSRYLSWVSQRY